ncbi:MAG TPA: PQQ-binding-like beta-propeller repeat protein [Solirubrobacterales bacterium]|nr:PQQ-binding-like beta-propeller repeat protein [Solirubrobacterales bacterium]
MTRVLDIWRGWTLRRRILFVGGVTAVLLAGAALALYLILLKRPADVVNPEAVFVPEPPKAKAKPKTENWPLYGYDNARTRYMRARGVNPPFNSSRWSFQAGKLLEFSPVVANDVLYFMDKDARFYAMNADNGKVKWKRRMGRLNASAPAFAGGRVFGVNLEPGQAFALRARDGKLLWKRDLPGRSESSPVVRRGKVVVGVESGDIFALDAKSGRVRWQVSTAGEVKGGVALDSGTVYAGNYAGEVLAISLKTGAVRWRTGTQGGSFGRTGRIYSTPAIAYGRVYLGSVDGRVYSFEAKTGELAWSQSTGDWVYAAPAVADTPNSPPTVYIGSVDQHFYALDARNGGVRWRERIGGPVLGAASVINETVYVAGIGPNVGTFGFRARTGKKVFEHELGEYNPVISDGHRLYLTGTSALRAFEPRRKGGKRARGKQGREGRAADRRSGKNGRRDGRRAKRRG